MSKLAIAAVIGSNDRNSGTPHLAGVVGHLYVGGSGVWVFHNVLDGAGATTAGPVRIRSNTDFAEELSAGFALAAGLDDAVKVAAARLGADWAQRDIDTDPKVLRAIGAPALELDIAMVLTDLGSDPSWLTENLGPLPWSISIALSAVEDRATQWG